MSEKKPRMTVLVFGQSSRKERVAAHETGQVVGKFGGGRTGLDTSSLRYLYT